MPESRIGLLLYNANIYLKPLDIDSQNYRKHIATNLPVCIFYEERLYVCICTVHLQCTLYINVHALHWREKSAKVEGDFAKCHSVKNPQLRKKNNLDNARFLSI